MPKPPNPNAPLCPHCHRPMRSSGSRWRCETVHGIKRGVKPIGAEAMTDAERQRAYRARKRGGE